MKQQKPASTIQKALNVWAISVFIWSIYRYYFKTSLPIWFDEFIAKPMVFLGPLSYYVTRYEKKNVLAAVDLKFKNIRADVILGLVIGLIFFSAAFFGYLTKYHSLTPLVSKLSISWILFYILISFASGISEEILSRGFVLKRLYEESKNVITSTTFASFLFFFLHVPILFSNPKFTGVILIQVMMTDIVLSFAVSFLYLQRRSVALPILIHAFYNLSIYLFI
ncbi:hypothetical protein A2966_02180 [Candidatus Roizmanbacteria bacterium RIFCSPLOWO2_01_FULL_41_22]|uniref:CAAX prenyl protease 2/Lysostaphin resistance protein A-like domain-containing protein n=2 Tax=Candidatus Roizmaniibacteriota TaxID=1752723 RepID=A0A1F7JQ85_9BACT|nr:MAG: hypothetical protein A2966_02180 [Candidatus Roizmanbacteria bacterium RIFCSPLOWO2_01_FULL_41_22]OGK57764.1 MAG: hypothetical protein A3H86_02745 [Candidatus Roizmanbacteria bacterium RIFCSPLOWO2_02_FULL_41_9]